MMTAQAIGSFEMQPQRLYKIRITGLSGADIIEISSSAGSAFLPNVSNEEVEVPYMNSRVYYAGRSMRESGTIACKDFIDLAVMDAINNWRKLVYDEDTGVMGYASQYKKDIEIILLDPSGAEKRSWTLIGAWPQSVNFGTLDVTSNEAVSIEMTIRYDQVKATKLKI